MLEAGWWVGWSASSWGLSWGVDASGNPIVVDEWDTSQGIARNLANNLKWEHVSDVTHPIPELVLQTATTVVKAAASATAQLTGVEATSHIGSLSAQFQGNGFARLRGHSLVVASGAVTAGADSSCAVLGSGVRSAAGRFSPTGDSVAAVSGVLKMGTFVPVLGTKAVKNPTDEQMAWMAIHNLLTSTYKRVKLAA